ncbi:enhancer of mRNA-decapping protein 4-like isoform X2 [Cynara cardunculus var. scolymus]|uniref:enhancer of mRNA-decapping protein 4-like isoform X2 n=1 Tax=Cynara cardunculus var. scolymus TaxID=59895 RepID=UPI000D62DEAB|nr:enhancer of mRNA-decapping protein 4-like isoform X2 [Cynara cardunculus var. scolymus]
MASPRNQNQQKGGAGGGGGGGGAFDVQRLFNPSVSSSPSSQITTLQNPNNPYLPPSSAAASYPPPTVTGGPYSYNPPQANNPMFHHQFHIPPPPFPPQSDNHLHSNLPHQRSLPYPASPLQPPSPNNTNPNPNHGARLMALLSSPLPSTPDMPPQLPPAPTQNLNFNAVLPSSAPLLPSGAGPLRMPSSKLPKGRHLVGDHVVYDIDVRLAGEIQPQLEVTPITKYGSDPGLVVGRQIAVNKTYICYGLKPGTIRVLNINTALRSLLKGLAQRVTDMAFFAEDVHLLASASMDGRVYVWKITEGPDEDDKPLITGKIVIAVQIVGEGEPFHPRVCWHCHKQEVLVVGIGKRILRLDTTKHDGEVTDLSMCQWMTTRLVSASVDGTIKIWEDHKSSPIAVLRPYDGLPVNSVTFLTAPHRPDHIILITGGPLNREVKIWASESEEGWLLPSDADSWHCTQTLELKSFAEPRVEDAFFNQVVALSQAGLLLLANAKKNAIYAVHLEYGPNPESTRMDYIAEFTVTMPILSFTGTSHLLLHGEHIVQVYCVQTQAIQQYALDLSQCLPPPIYDVVHEKSGSTEGCSGSETSGGKLDEIGSEGAPTLSQPVSSPLTDVAISKGLFTSGAEAKSIPSPIANDTDISCVVSPTVPTSPKLSGKLSDFRSPSSGFEPRNQLNGYGDQKIMELEAAHSNLSSVVSLDDDIRTENKVAKDDGSTIPDRTVKFKHPTHLVTPAELMATSSSEVNHVTDDVAVNSATKNVEAEIKVMGKMGISQNADSALQGELHGSAFEVKEKSFSSQASGLGLDMARDNHVEPRETYMVKESKQLNEIVESKVVDQTSDARDDGQDTATDLSGPVQPTVPGMVQSAAPTSRAKKQKGKNVQTLRALKSIDSSDELGASSSIPSAEAILSQIQSMQATINQVLISQKEIQKQIPVMAASPITKEGKRIEAVVGKSMEKIYKANSDAWWARTQEEFAKQEKTNRDRHQQISTSASNGHKDLLAASEKSMKKEMAAAVSVIGRSVTPVIEKAVSTAVSESFQRGIGDKAVNQLEKTVNSKLEANVSRQIQAQFQTSGRQALQEALKSSMEASVIPAFEMSCKTMFDQVDATFQNGIVEHTSAAQRQAESVHSPLVFALRDTINSASSVTQILSNELSDGQRKLMALAVAGATSKLVNPLISNGPSGGFHEKIEAPVDPAKELSRLIYEHKYEEAFTTALQRSDVQIVSWLCSQVDLQGILTRNPIPLSQGVLLSLLQQLACDIVNDTSKKLGWMMDLVVAIKPSDGIIAMHVRPIFEQVQSMLNHQASLLPTTSVAELSSIRVVMKLVNSTLRSL